MCTQQHFHVMKLAQLVMINGDESVFVESFHLHAVVYNVSKTVECTPFGQFFLGFLDGCGHAKTETTAIVNFYL